MKKLPQQKPGIIMRKIGDEAMLYDTNGEMVHILNATAEVVWNCCDGSTSTNEAGQKLKESFNFTKEHDVREDIKHILADFAEMNLLK